MADVVGPVEPVGDCVLECGGVGAGLVDWGTSAGVDAVVIGNPDAAWGSGPSGLTSDTPESVAGLAHAEGGAPLLTIRETLIDDDCALCGLSTGTLCCSTSRNDSSAVGSRALV
jgi:hypothetical protein